MNHETNPETNKESCCHTSKSSCCGVKKCIVRLLIALLLFGLGFYVGKSNICPWQMHPISQSK